MSTQQLGSDGKWSYGWTRGDPCSALEGATGGGALEISSKVLDKLALVLLCSSVQDPPEEAQPEPLVFPFRAFLCFKGVRFAPAKTRSLNPAFSNRPAVPAAPCWPSGSRAPPSSIPSVCIPGDHSIPLTHHDPSEISARGQFVA